MLSLVAFMFMFFCDVAWIPFRMLEQPRRASLYTWEFRVLLWGVQYMLIMLA